MGRGGASAPHHAGTGGQRLIVLPDLEIVVAMPAGNYDAPDEGQMALTIVQEVILPSLDG
jgi:hypothetical protein